MKFNINNQNEIFQKQFIIHGTVFNKNCLLLKYEICESIFFPTI